MEILQSHHGTRHFLLRHFVSADRPRFLYVPKALSASLSVCVCVGVCVCLSLSVCVCVCYLSLSTRACRHRSYTIGACRRNWEWRKGEKNNESGTKDKKQTAGMEAADRCSKTTTAKESSTRCREKQKTPGKKRF